MRNFYLCIIVLLLSLNVITAEWFRSYILNKKPLSVVKVTKKETYRQAKLMILPGFFNNARNASKFLNNSYSYNLILISYSNFGFDPKLYAKELEKQLKECDIVLSISIGDQIAANLDTRNTRNTKRIAVNPATSNYFFQGRIKRQIATLQPFSQALGLSLGWLGFAPCIPVEGEWQSLRLLLDQLNCLGRLNANMLEKPPTATVLSKRDELLDNTKISHIWPHADQIFIDCAHGRTAGSDFEQKQYRYAVETILINK